MYTQEGTTGTSGQVTKRLIRDLFPGLPDNIDAATIWTGNNKAYFFKGTDHVYACLHNVSLSTYYFEPTLELINQSTI